MRAYLDHNASSPLRPDARAAMLDALETCGNASSVHTEGRAARARIEAARAAVAARLGCIAASVIFTGGGTEACNLAVKGAPAERLLVSAIEHPAVLEAARASGRLVSLIPVTGEGVVDLDVLDALLARDPRRALVSVMLANNETGAIQPVGEIVAIAARHGALVHTDAAQAAGRIPVNFALLGVDMLSLSAHKFGGPPGAGALVVRDGLVLDPVQHGGGQELRRRAGSENVAAIAGLAAALQAAGNDGDLAIWRDRLVTDLETAGATVLSRQAGRLPNTVCFAMPGIAAETALMSLDLDGVAVSTGSACSSGKVAASHVLTAMGVAPDLAACAVRVSLGWTSTADDIETFTAAWHRLVDRRKAVSDAA